MATNKRDEEYYRAIPCDAPDMAMVHMKSCEVAYKNRNVYLDISGLLAGDESLIKATEQRTPVMHHYTLGLVYLNNYTKVLFGTDWPLVPLAPYIDFCRKLVPESAYKDVFYDNAVRLFRLNDTVMEISGIEKAHP